VIGRVVVRTLSFLALAAAELSGCADAGPRAPTILRPIDEPHAVQAMATVFRQFGLEPVRNRMINIGAEGTPIRLDVAAKDKLYGIAYITFEDAEKLGDALPKRRDPDAIMIVQGGQSDVGAHAAILFAADYMEDDLSGESHTSTSIAAQQRLELAVKDFLRRAEHEKWP
jgi:hypothetical protein